MKWFYVEDTYFTENNVTCKCIGLKKGEMDETRTKPQDIHNNCYWEFSVKSNQLFISIELRHNELLADN